MVICGTVLLTFAGAQIARKTTASKGPRALALLELAANGKGHLVPIVIMYNGQFYDASVFKADPVPMALQSGTVYEVEQTGVSKGLFTVAGARQLNDTWLGVGKWEPGGPKIKVTKIGAAPKPPDQEDDKPPVLKRPKPESEKTPTPAPTSTPAPASSPASPPPSTTASAPTPAAPAASTEAAPEDSDHPVLRRGMPAAREEWDDDDALASIAAKPAGSKSGAASTAAKSTAASAPVQIIPAISDAGGPQPQSYQFEMKPQEEQEFKTKMLAMASSELAAHSKGIAGEDVGPEPPRGSAKRRAVKKPAQPSFEDVQLRVFDLSSSNEPTLVLTATARKSSSDVQYYITLVARNDIYNELQKGFANITDSRHLDVTPRLELIDAVDVDGDGRGELLFRQISDSGSSYIVYRVIGDQLYALYQGTSGG